MPKISIIILTFNSSRYITDLLKSIDGFKDAEIIVVDNNSDDDTLSKIKKFGSDVGVFSTGKNLGFAKGINFGVEKSKGEYVLFINPDCVFEDGDIKNLMDKLAKDKEVGIIGGRIIDKNGKNEKSAGKFFNLFEVVLMILGLDEMFGVRFSPEKERKVDFVSGGFMMVKKEIFEELNGFDEDFFMYVEDMEFCFRAKKMGIETLFTPSVAVSHAGQGSSNRSFAIVNIYKGILLFYKKHKNKIEFELAKVMLKIKATTVYILGRITNNSYYIKTYSEALDVIK